MGIGQKVFGHGNRRARQTRQHLVAGLRKIGANSDGSPVWGIAPARAFELSNSFEF